MRVIGLMSGTSIDGIDAAFVELHGSDHDLQVNLIAAQTVAYNPAVRDEILALSEGAAMNLAEIAMLDDRIAQAFATAAIAVQTDHPPADLIGSHGQTVYHRPPQDSARFESPFSRRFSLPYPARKLGYSWQLGRGEAIAHLTGIPTVSNFRAADLALGGQGAPLVPRVDACLLSHPDQTTAVQNLGGIGNVTYLPARSQLFHNPDLHASIFGHNIYGWDTGPGNVLLDLAVQTFSDGQQRYDQDGQWAATGTICQPLLEQWLADPFFMLPPPKSTGREYFGTAQWRIYQEQARAFGLTEADILATLTELTVLSIVESYQRFLPSPPDRILLCGGGSRNRYLRQRFQAHLDPDQIVQTTDDVGIDADAKEAIAFAILAYWRWLNLPGNLPSVTGARHAVSLGELWRA